MFLSKQHQKFADYYQTYFEKIYNYIFFRVGNNRQLAEEFTQDVFMKALENFDSFDENSEFKTWIYRIAHNHIIDHYRKKKITEADLDSVSNMVVASKAAEETFVKDIEVKMIMGKVTKSLNKLADLQQQLIILRYINEYEIEEIASIVGQDANYVRVNIHRALQKLHSFIKNNDV